MPLRIAGVDLGKSAVKLALLAQREDGGYRIESTCSVPHAGDPLRVFAELYVQHALQRCAALGATGLYSTALRPPALGALPEDACLEAALASCGLGGALNVVSVGARGYSALSRDAQGRVRHAEHDKCSAGTGETIVKNAGRFGLDIAQADALALGAEDSIPITARCSVFAKSELTHFGNQGRPADQLFRGYFDSIARHVAALLARVRIDGPVYVIGGGSRLQTLRTSLAEQLGVPVLVPEHALAIEAIGAAQIAADELAERGALAALPQDPHALIENHTTAFSVLKPVRTAQARVTRLAATPVAEHALHEPAILGLDLGSTGSKAVLSSLASGEPVVDVYDRTRGNPVQAAQRLVQALLDRGTLDVRAIAVTGSGREAVATVLRAAYPEQAARIYVSNEIVAHATAAIRCDDQHGRSLSVVEIGGQDAKFIQIAGGQIVESNMNKACSAGTGSFLEEQAIFYGVDDIARFDELAQLAMRPPDLGQMCTVFVAEAATQAEAAGFERNDIFAGFQYSVVHNYKNRVMGQRTFGERIFFQGKPASSVSLAWTLAAVTGREVIVPPNPGAMGAWGVGLCARDDLGLESLLESAPFALATLLTAQVAARTEIRCQDKSCATLCTIERTTVAVAEQSRQVFSGGACPKFEISTAARPKLPASAPAAFDERQALVDSYARDRAGTHTVLVPNVGTLAGYLPWATTFLAELDLGVRVLQSDAHALKRGEDLCHAYDACAPVKVAHALVDRAAEAHADTAGPSAPPLFFMPKIIDLAGPGGAPRTTCANEQAIADVAPSAVRATGKRLEVVAPVLSFAQGPLHATLVRELRKVASALGADAARVEHAARAAAVAQSRYERTLLEIGRRTLAYGRLNNIPIVVVCGSLHVIFDRAIHAGVPSILRDNGVLALPMDCFPIPAHIDALARVPWTDLNHALRVSLASRERGDAFPLLLSAFGCGPASFGEQLFDALLADYPHTALETDGHGGNAGYVTRVQSFLHGVRRYGCKPAPLAPERLAVLEPAPKPSTRDRDKTRLVILPIGDRLGQLAAATYRSLGYDAVAAGPGSPEMLAHGRRECSGKECLPYQLIWGGFRQQLLDEPADKPTLLVQVQGQGACRNCMFSVKDRMSVEHLGLQDRVELRHFGVESTGGQGMFFGKFWASTVAWDILNQLAAYHRPLEREPGAVDALYTQHCDVLEAIAEKKTSRGLKGLVQVRTTRSAYHDLLRRAARDFARVGRSDDKRAPVVLLTGDIYVRVDEFANDHLARRLNERGLRVLLDPVSMLVEYLVEERSAELLGLPTEYFENAITRAVMRRTRRALYDCVRPEHPWLPMPDVPGALRAGAPVLGRHPLSEAPIGVGTYMQAVADRSCDGIVVASPWGCSPALISESLLRQQREVPTLFVYADGTPLDERRLNGFAYRLRRSPRRVRTSA